MGFGSRRSKIWSPKKKLTHLRLNLDLDLELLTMFTRNSRNRTRNSTNQIVHFFKFKKFQPKFHFCFLVAKPRWPGLVGVLNPVDAILRACLLIFLRYLVQWKIFWYQIFFAILLLLFLSLKCTNQCCMFFACCKLIVFIVSTHLSCVIICLFACFLFSFFALYMQSLACFIFCHQFVDCLADFSCRIAHFCTICFFAGSCRCNLLDLGGFLLP